MKIPVNSAGVVTAFYVCTDTFPLSINSLNQFSSFFF